MFIAPRLCEWVVTDMNLGYYRCVGPEKLTLSQHEFPDIPGVLGKECGKFTFDGDLGMGCDVYLGATLL